MPRIRTIKPEFWTDGDIVDMSFAARLLFIGSWNFAICDRGHVADDPKRLKMQVLPGDAVDASELLDEILAHGRMERLTAPDGRTYLLIKRFTDHQKIEKRWNPRCPACDAFGLNGTSENLPQPLPTSREVGRETADLSETPRTSAQEGKGGEGKGGERVTRKRALPDDFAPNEHHRRLAAEHRVDLRREFAKFADYHRAKGSTMKDWNAALNNWIRKAAEYGGATILPMPAVDDPALLPPPEQSWMRRRPH